jgi:hypothetical protein
MFPLRQAVEGRDLDAMVDAFTPDAVIHSPITFKTRFRGRAEIRELLAAVLEAFEDVRYVEHYELGNVRIVIAQARVGGRPIEEVQVMRMDAEGRVRDFRLYIRGLAGLAAVAAALGPRLARSRGRLRARLVAVAIWPLAFVTKATDSLGVRLALGRKPES